MTDDSRPVDADAQTEREPDDVLITRAGPFVGALQTFHDATSIEIRLDLWPAEDDEADDDAEG